MLPLKKDQVLLPNNSLKMIRKKKYDDEDLKKLLERKKEESVALRKMLEKLNSKNNKLKKK